MKFHHLLLVLPLAVIACSHADKSIDISDYTATYYQPRYSEGFEIKCHPSDSSLLLVTYTPDTMYTAIPPGGFKRIGVMSTTHVAMLEAAAAADRLVSASSPQYISSPKVRAMNLPDHGFEGAMDYETILAAKPDLMMIYSTEGGESEVAGKLRELSVPYVYISDFLEQNPIGRAEWVVAAGALVGADMRESIDSVAAAYTPRCDSVAVMLNAPYSGTWFIPGADSYISRLITDAGGYIPVELKAGSRSSAIDPEVALPALSSASIWLNPGQFNSLAELQQAVPKSKFNGRVWNQLPDFYESGAIRPDLVLSDLKMIINDSAPADSLRYFHRLK